MKRSQQKRISIRAKVLRYMRVSRGIPQRETARRCGLSEGAIGHYENGRMDVSEARLKQFLAVYRYTIQDLEAYENGRPIPIVSVKDECLALLSQVDETKLRTIHAVLQGFVKN